jgi:hypothetical protein
MTPRAALLMLLAALPAAAAAAPAEDFAQKIAAAIGRTCRNGAPQTLTVRGFASVSLSGNGGLDRDADAVLIRAGSPVAIKYTGPDVERSLTSVKCDLRITPIVARDGDRLVVQRSEGVPDPFLTKVLAGDLAGVRELVRAGQDVNIASPLSPLMAAAGRGNLDMTRYLLGQGARVNARAPNGKTALHAAAEFGTVEVAKLLLENGAQLDLADANGYTPLWSAAWNNRPEMIELFLQRGARLRHRDRKGNSALFAAAANGADDAVRRLVEAGLDPPAKNNIGRTPLLDAIDARKPSTVALFIQLGVDVNARTQSGQTPIGRARSLGDAGVIEMLEKAGAK